MKTTPRSTILILALLSFGSTVMLAGESTPSANQPAKVVAAASPVYPYLLRHAGSTGEVTVVFTVNAKGVVTNAAIVDSNNFEFNASSLDAIRKWTFTPATKNGQAVETRLKQTFTYNVRDNSLVARPAAQVANKAR